MENERELRRKYLIDCYSVAGWVGAANNVTKLWQYVTITSKPVHWYRGIDS